MTTVPTKVRETFIKIMLKKIYEQPNNKMAAMKLMQSLKKRFERDEPFYSQYKCFIDELIDKKYARKCDCVGPEGRTWYVPH